MEAIIAFLVEYKALLGAMAGVLEAMVVLVNVWKKFVSATTGEVETMSASPSRFKAFLWVVNPINVFRKHR